MLRISADWLLLLLLFGDSLFCQHKFNDAQRIGYNKYRFNFQDILYIVYVISQSLSQCG